MVSDNQLLPHYGALQKTGLHNDVDLMESKSDNMMED
jgi:hypothetical protein